MTTAIVTLSGWGLFYGGLILYIVWVVAERTFFAGSDPERWSPESHDTTGGRKPRPGVHFVSAAPLRRAA
jgi:hypothetical protein